MPITPRRALLAGSALALALPAIAQTPRAWPDGPIRLVAPFPPGGSSDLLCRLLQNPLQTLLGVPIIVENRPGASGSIGTAAVARAPADGQTFVLVFDTHVVNPVLIPSLGYDPARDLKAVMLVGTAPMLLTTAATARRWTNLAEVIDRARQAPETVTYGTVGAGSLAHLTMERVQAATRTKMLHVPYRGTGPAISDLIAGNVNTVFDQLSTALPLHLDGRARILAVGSAARSPLLPDVPTFREAGLVQPELTTTLGLLAPAGTPPAVIETLRAALAATLADPAIRSRLQALGAEVATGDDVSPRHYSALIADELETSRRAVALPGVKLE